MKKFGLIGAAGYIAPRHMRAIKEIGHELIIAMDPHDSVGIIDHYFPKAEFLTDFNDFRSEILNIKPDYLTICSPNDHHFQHISMALQHNITPICEKPVALTLRDLEGLQILESQSNVSINTIMQLRLHPVIKKLKENLKDDQRYAIDLKYIAPRGRWYHNSWKGDLKRSGGLATNIGIHFFDMLIELFGAVEQSRLHVATAHTMGGDLHLKNGDVRWLLSIDPNYQQLRQITINREEIVFTGGFDQLHTESYKEIINGTGFGLKDAFAGIKLVESLRYAKTIGLQGDYHPDLRGMI